MGKVKPKPMKKVVIKRIKHTKPKLSTKAKVLAGLGLGTTLAGFGAGGAVGKATNSQPMVRVQDQNKDSKTGKVKKVISDIFGVKEAKAMADPFADKTDISPSLADSLAAQGRYQNYLNNSIYGNIDYSTAHDAYSQAFGIPQTTVVEQTGSGEAGEEGNGLPTDGQTEGLGEGSGEGRPAPFVPTWLNPNNIPTPEIQMPDININPGDSTTPVPSVIQQGIDQMNNTPAPVAVGSDSNGNQIYFNNGQYQDYTGNVYTSNIENGQTVYNPVTNTDPLNLGQGGVGDRLPDFPTGIKDSQENIILNNTQINADNFLTQPWQEQSLGVVVGQDAQGHNIYQNSNGDWVDATGNILQKQTLDVTDSTNPIEYAPAVYNFAGERTDIQMPIITPPAPIVITEVPNNFITQNNATDVSNLISTLAQQGVMALVNTDGTYTLLNVNTGQTEQKTLEQMVETSIVRSTSLPSEPVVEPSSFGIDVTVPDQEVQGLGDQDMANANQQISNNLVSSIIANNVAQTPESAPEVKLSPAVQASEVAENIFPPSMTLMTAEQLRAEVAKHQSTPAEALASVRTSENNPTLNFIPLTLTDGTKVTTTNGVDYKDAGGNSYFYAGVEGQDLLKYDSKAGVFVSVSAVNSNNSLATQTQNTINSISKTTTTLQEKASRGISTGIGAITNKIRGNDSDKADNINLDSSKLKTLGRLAVMGGASMVAGPAGGLVSGVISGSPMNWEKLVDWATDPKDIGRPGTVFWTDPQTRQKYSISKNDVQAALAVIQANGNNINP